MTERGSYPFFRRRRAKKGYDPFSSSGLIVTVLERGRHTGVGAGLGRWLALVAPRRAHGHVTVAIVPDRTVRALNRQFRGVDRATDVLSFPSGSAGGPVRRAESRFRGRHLQRAREDPGLGDIVIARGVARAQAREGGHPMAVEVRILALHGLLHLLGYDHETDAGRMARLEGRLRRLGGLQ